MRFALFFVLFLGVFAGSSIAQTQDSAPRITVTGEGTVSAAPDMATVQLGVTEEADSAAVAMERTSAAMGAILETLADSGVEPRDIQTTNINLSPRYGRPVDNRQPEVTGYIASNMVMVRVRDLAALGPVLDALVQEGANAINGISFAVSDSAALESEARARAVADARAKAEEFAAAAGVTLGPVLSIDEGGASRPQPLMRSMAMDESVPIAAGEVDLSAFVTITYAIGE